MSQLTRSCRYSRGDVHLILDGWMVEEYRVLRDSIHEVSTPLLVIQWFKFKSQKRGILLHLQVGNIWFTSQRGLSESRLFIRVDKIVIRKKLSYDYFINPYESRLFIRVDKIVIREFLSCSN